MGQSMENVQKSYDQVADEYTSRFFHELEHKPLDRALLDLLAERVRGLGLVADLGCGPGHAARYLHERKGIWQPSLWRMKPGSASWPTTP